MSSPARHVVVTSDQSLIADTVGAALAGPALLVIRVPWQAEETWTVVAETPADAGVLLCDLQPPPRLTRVCAVLRRWALPWLVLTGAPRGALWGAVLEAGAAGVLRHTCSLDDLRDAVDRVAGGRPLIPEVEVAELRAAWHAVEEERRVALRRVQSLSPRETAVLARMHAGQSVQRIATEFDVSPATVRSQVRAVLRKLDVSSQLAAVAIYEVAGPGADPEAPVGRTAPGQAE